jgi:hypothetical protein
MLKGDSTKKKTRVLRPFSGMQRTPVTWTSDEIAELALDLISKNPKQNIDMHNSTLVAEVLCELAILKIEAFQQSDYARAKQISGASDRLRAKFRVRDRDSLHCDRFSELEHRLAMAKAALSAGCEAWSRRESALAAESQRELQALSARHSDQLIALEDTWRGSRTARRFSKKSSHLLNSLKIEKSLVLIGDFDRAMEMRRINQRTEKAEEAVGYGALAGGFEAARQQMLADHRREIDELRANQNARRSLLLADKEHEIEVLTNRMHAVRQVLEDEGNYNNFVARKFRKPADIIVAMSVTANGAADLPPDGQQGTAKERETLRRFREATVATPLNLPPLKVKALKGTKKGRRGARMDS